eukprot:873817-Rhodomonas_salina.1
MDSVVSIPSSRDHFLLLRLVMDSVVSIPSPSLFPSAITECHKLGVKRETKWRWFVVDENSFLIPLEVYSPELQLHAKDVVFATDSDVLMHWWFEDFAHSPQLVLPVHFQAFRVDQARCCVLEQ